MQGKTIQMHITLFLVSFITFFGDYTQGHRNLLIHPPKNVKNTWYFHVTSFR